MYQCATACGRARAARCRASTGSHTVPAGSYGMTPGGHRRDRSAAHRAERGGAAVLQAVPVAQPGRPRIPATSTDFRFAAPIENDFRTYIARGDYRRTATTASSAASTSRTTRINSTPQYPGHAPDRAAHRSRTGAARRLGLDLRRQRWSTRFRYGFTKIDDRHARPAAPELSTTFRFIDAEFDERRRLVHQRARRRTTQQLRRRPVDGEGPPHLEVRQQHAVHRATTTTPSPTPTSPATPTARGWPASAAANMPGGACPAPADCSGLPAVARTGSSAYADSLIPNSSASSRRRTARTTTTSTARRRRTAPR